MRKGIQEIIVRRKDNTQFEFIGINEFGEKLIKHFIYDRRNKPK